jgi:hypothetical protein
LIFPKQFAGEFRANELRAAAGGSVHDKHGVRHFAGRVFVDFAECPIMNFQLGQRFAGSKLEIPDGLIALGRWWIISGEK